MKKHIGTKLLLAVAMTLGEYNLKRGWTIPQDEDPHKEGYLVEYPLVGDEKPNHPDHEGYISWSPKAAFEESYRSIDSMNFGLAIEALKKGLKVARSGWNGKGMFLWLLPASEVKKEWIKDPMLLEVFGERDSMEMLGSIRMKTATGEVLTGWLASQTDMLADDWQIVE